MLHKYNLRISPKNLKTSRKADLSMDNEVIHIRKGPSENALMNAMDDKMDKKSMTGGYGYESYDNLAMNTEMMLMTILAVAIICLLLCVASIIGCFVMKKLKQLSFPSRNRDKLQRQRTRNQRESVDNV